MTQISFSEPAAQDLEEIYEHIALDNIVAAERLLAKLQKRWQLAAKAPGAGRKRDQLLPNLSSVREGNYLIFYLPTADGIEIIRILHGARDIETLFDP